MAADDVKIRLLICGLCKTIDELPWFEGPQEYDDTGNYRLAEHSFGDGRLHPFTVGDVLKSEWDKPTVREAIVRQITLSIDGNAEEGLGNQFYEVKANFEQDAMTCWKQHGRPGSQHKSTCEDFYSSRKLLLADTRAERRAEGLDPKTRSKTYLCQFCPYFSTAQTRYRDATGQYDN